MVKFSKTFALFIKESEFSFRNILDRSFGVKVRYIHDNDYRRNISGKVILSNNSKFNIKISGEGSFQFFDNFNRDIYFLDSSIQLLSSDLKKFDYVFFGSDEIISFELFDKFWKENVKVDIFEEKREASKKEYIIPLIRCKLLSLENSKNNKWNMRLVEV